MCTKGQYKKKVVSILRQPTVFQKPRLLKPPEIFRDLLKHYIKEDCERCKGKPKKSVICLICGSLLCYNDEGHHEAQERS